MVEGLAIGYYRSGTTVLHRLDPRVKLLGLPLVLVCVFSGRDVFSLLVVGGLAAALCSLAEVGWGSWWPKLRMLRWLLFFTLILHTCLSPGRGFFGLPFLSMDGFFLGAAISFQLVLAILFSSLLIFTTRSEDIVAAFSSLLAPCVRFGLPVDRISRFLMLVLHFLPLLHREAMLQFGASPGCGHGLGGRFRMIPEVVGPLVTNLVKRADSLAEAFGRGEVVVQGRRLDSFDYSNPPNIACFALGFILLCFLLV